MKFVQTAVIAPHASHPPMDGASYRAWSLAKQFSMRIGPCIYLAKSRFLRLDGDSQTETLAHVPRHRGKVESAIRAVVLGSHYLVEKHLPKVWIRNALQVLSITEPQIVYLNFLWSYNTAFAALSRNRLYIDTHNFDPEWWDNLRLSRRNCWSTCLCKSSSRYSTRTLQNLPPYTKLVHVSSADAEEYRKLRPDLRHFVVANGCDLQPRGTIPDYAARPKRLYFLGALNVQVTADALMLFATRFWPALQEHAQMFVFGSGKSRQVDSLCRRLGWSLERNLSEEALTNRLEKMHYIVLPFSYSAGSKLKFINACARGIPTIATPEAVRGFGDMPPTVFVSSDSAGWRDQITTSKGPSSDDLHACLSFARQFSWGVVFNSSGLADDMLKMSIPDAVL